MSTERLQTIIRWDELYGGQVPSSNHSLTKTYLKLTVKFEMLRDFNEHFENFIFH